jgi:oligopeptide/dipeptide ABC transporter ATP-binding protein
VSARLLEVENLSTQFRTSRGTVGAVDGVSLHVGDGEAIGIVGESGSGKSVSALSILRLVPMPGRVVGGSVKLRGEDLLALPEREMRRVRSRRIAMIFQDASNFLNPVLPIGQQVGESLIEAGEPRAAVRRIVIEALRAVRIPDAERVIDYYPFQMSGGMQQRAVIASAVVRRPDLIIADEPTTALDATVQYQVLRLLADLQTALGTGLILISHDLAVVASLCSRVYVMYAAQVVETGSASDIYRAPAHPYTQGLLGSLLDPLEKKELKLVAGSLPDLSAPPRGCRFHPRCPHAMKICTEVEPPMLPVAQGQTAKCWLHDHAVMATSAASAQPDALPA